MKHLRTHVFIYYDIVCASSSSLESAFLFRLVFLSSRRVFGTTQDAKEWFSSHHFAFRASKLTVLDRAFTDALSGGSGILVTQKLR